MYCCLISQHIVELGLVDSVAKNENLGYVRICIKITPLSEGEGADSHHSPSPREDKKQKTGGSKIWTSVVTVTLLEGKNLPPMDQNGETQHCVGHIIVIMASMKTHFLWFRHICS